MQTLLCLAATLAGAHASKIGLFYATTTGNTEEVAELIGEKTGLEVQDIYDKKASDLMEYDYLIVGAPTWATSQPKMRTETYWDELMYDAEWGLPTVDMTGKMVAVFGLGDSVGYAMDYCDAMDELEKRFGAGTKKLKGAGATTVGFTSKEGYTFDMSKSLRKDESGERNTFCGLPLDQKNQDDMTSDRLDKWLAQLKEEGFPLECARRRRLNLDAMVLSSEKEWYDEWRDRFSCWWSDLPMNQRQRLAECKGALTQHVSLKMADAAGSRGMSAGPDGHATSEHGCEWVREEGGFLRNMPSLPNLPSLPNFKFTWPRVPEHLLPWGVQKWNQMSSMQEFYESDMVAAAPRAAPQRHEQASVETTDEVSVTMAAMAGGAAGMLTVGLVFLVGTKISGRNRRSFTAKFGSPTTVEITPGVPQTPGSQASAAAPPTSTVDMSM